MRMLMSGVMMVRVAMTCRVRFAEMHVASSAVFSRRARM